MPNRKMSDAGVGDTVSPGLDDEQMAILERLMANLDPSLACLRTVFSELNTANKEEMLPHQKPIPTRPATYYQHVADAAVALGVEFKDFHMSYHLDLKFPHSQDPAKLSEPYAAVINDLKTSKYVSTNRDEGFCRTVLDLILIDRLHHLEDKDAFRRLQVSAEVPVAVRIKNSDGEYKIVRGKPDWVVGYGTDKTKTGAILLIVEAKRHPFSTVGMPQLLVYMAAVYEARANDKQAVKQSVFGILSDSHDFYFCHLDTNKKLFKSKPYSWYVEQSTILAYIDSMLTSAIESAPAPTPYMVRNPSIRRYSDYLSSQWNFGTEWDDEEETGDTEGEEEEYH